MTIRICFDARIVRRWDTGVGRITVSLLRAIPSVAPDFEVTLLLDERVPPPPESVERTVLVRSSRIGSPSLRQHFLLPRWLSRERIDLVFHLHPYSVPAWSRVPNIVSILDLYQLRDSQSFPVGTGLYYRTVVASAARRSAAVLTISAASKADIVTMLRVPPGRITVLPLAAERIFHHIPQGPERDEVLRRLGVKEPFVLYHGNQRPHKNLSRLVQAFARARRRFDLPHRLVITGKEEPGSRDRDFGAVRNTIISERIEPLALFPGYVSDQELAVLYSAAGALFLPSLMEGFGLPVIEAFACGAPVVCANRGALVEVAGNAAVLVDPLDIEDMALKLAGVLIDESTAKTLRERGHARSLEFTWRQSAEVFYGLVRAVLGQARRRVL